MLHESTSKTGSASGKFVHIEKEFETEKILLNANSSLSASMKSSGSLRKTSSIGGNGGSRFDDASKLSTGEWLLGIVLRSGRRVDRIEFHTTRQTLRHGGSGGRQKSLSMNHGEWIEIIDVCEDHHRSNRIFYVKFRTTRGRTLSGGTRNGSCHIFRFKRNHHVFGMHGRSGNEIDRLGFIYKIV